jgi:hypothetical protein
MVLLRVANLPGNYLLAILFILSTIGFLLLRRLLLNYDHYLLLFLVVSPLTRQLHAVLSAAGFSIIVVIKVLLRILRLVTLPVAELGGNHVAIELRSQEAAG